MAKKGQLSNGCTQRMWNFGRNECERRGSRLNGLPLTIGTRQKKSVINFLFLCPPRISKNVTCSQKVQITKSMSLKKRTKFVNRDN